MATTERPVLTGARWSHATRCVRMAAYDVLGAFPSAPTPQQEGFYRRGHEVEDSWLTHDLPQTYSGRVHRQAEIPWGDGWTAHVDAILLDDPARPHLEVKSTLHTDRLPGVAVNIEGVETTSAVLQVVGGAHYDPEGGVAEVVAVNPSDYTEQRYPIVLSADLVGAVEEVAGRVTHAARTGELPARVCRKPSDAIGRHCPYAADCFASYEDPGPVDLTHDDDALMLARDLLLAQQALKREEGDIAELKAKRDELRSALIEHGVTAGVDYQIGDIQIRLTEVKGRETFDYKAAAATGHLDLASLDGFLKTGQPSERWTVKEDSP